MTFQHFQYTKIPHDKLKSVLYHIINFCFNAGISKFVEFNYRGATWTDEYKDTGMVFSKDDIKKTVDYLMLNCYFTIGNKIFRQVIGIPIGSDPAPFFANLFLYYYESEWVKSLKKTDLIKAQKLKNMFRFIDDLNAVNDSDVFHQNIAEIYPVELELSRENINDKEANFLDLDIKIKNNQFDISLYDKRDDFNFHIVRMPFKSSNMPSSMFYNTLGAES